MSGFLIAAWWFIVTLGVLVTFHEFGHYWVARRCGVKVLRFSVGFGRPLWSRLGADGTRYQIAMIPLGGYVQFLDERENVVDPAERDRAFNRQPVLKRIAIVIAGPLANLPLCVTLFWIALMIGIPGLAPVLGAPSGLAEQAGLRQGDRILSVGEQPTLTWNQAITPIALGAIDRQPVWITIEDTQGNVARRQLPLDRLPPDFDQADPLKAIGLATSLAADLPVVGEVGAGFPAEGKLQAGDRIVRIDDQSIARYSEIPATLAAKAADGGPVAVGIVRQGRSLQVLIEPRAVTVGGRTVWQLGILPHRDLTLLRHGPVGAFRAALAETGKQSREMLGFIARLVTGKASSKNLSGVIGIAQVARSEARTGASSLIWFMASLSLTLCIMNLLPIPVLDGGHLLYYLIELISGRPVGERVLIAGQYAGLLLLAGLICLAFYNDIVRTIS